MPKIKLPKQTMLDILWESNQMVCDNVIGSGRWTITHEIVFSFQGKLYQTSYRTGSTEMQDERPWEYEDEVTCTEVVIGLVPGYVPVPNTPEAIRRRL